MADHLYIPLALYTLGDSVCWACGQPKSAHPTYIERPRPTAKGLR
jgi:hypothetical protein